MNQENSVINRYRNAAKKHEENLCCPSRIWYKVLKDYTRKNHRERLWLRRSFIVSNVEVPEKLR